MARSSTDLPRMQNQSRVRAPLERSLNIVSQAIDKTVKSKEPSKPPMMRQYDLIERVRRYNPATSEALLNRAYVYAMKAHGEQKRASGDPYFSHPLEVAAILTDLKLDDATIAAALLHDTIEDTAATRSEIDQMFGPDIGALVEGLTKLKKLDLVTKEAKQAENLRKLLAGDRRRRAGAAGQAGRPAAQHAHARAHAARDAAACRRGDPRHLCPARRPHGHARDARGARGFGVPRAQPRRLQGGQRTPRSAGSEESRAGHRDRAAAHQEARRPRHRRRGDGSAQTRLFDLAQDGAKIGRLRAALRHFRLPRGREDARRVLPGARHRAHHLAGRAGPLQGLHLDAQAERLPLDSHDRDRSEPAARRAADPHAGHARDRRIRHRRARALQGRCRLAHRNALARIERLCVAAPHHRAARGGLQSGGVPRAYQARAVPRPGVLLHARRAS